MNKVIHKYRFINGQRCIAQFQWEPRDLWVGIFWRKGIIKHPIYETLHICICILPLVPLHITILLKIKK